MQQQYEIEVEKGARSEGEGAAGGGRFVDRGPAGYSAAGGACAGGEGDGCEGSSSPPTGSEATAARPSKSCSAEWR